MTERYPLTFYELLKPFDSSAVIVKNQLNKAWHQRSQICVFSIYQKENRTVQINRTVTAVDCINQRGQSASNSLHDQITQYVICSDQ